MSSFRSLASVRARALSRALFWGALLVSAAIVAAAPVDDKRIKAAGEDDADWLTHGRTYDEQRFSPLAKIDQSNVKDLKLAWYFDLDTKRGQEATPLVVDGTMYVTSAWSKVFALDARTGKEKWRFDPQVAGDKAIDACCDVVNRGVAAWGRSVFVGTLDGRLIALDMHSGKPLWSVQTTDPKKRYTITGAPRVIKGKVIIGNGNSTFSISASATAAPGTIASAPTPKATTCSCRRSSRSSPIPASTCGTTRARRRSRGTTRPRSR
jgi:quinohemoprotein ethanol dehydrogenase